jgi:hypothetical protein
MGIYSYLSQVGKSPVGTSGTDTVSASLVCPTSGEDATSFFVFSHFFLDHLALAVLGRGAGASVIRSMRLFVGVFSGIMVAGVSVWRDSLSQLGIVSLLHEIGDPARELVSSAIGDTMSIAGVVVRYTLVDISGDHTETTHAS